MKCPACDKPMELVEAFDDGDPASGRTKHYPACFYCSACDISINAEEQAADHAEVCAKYADMDNELNATPNR